ncbi:MAG: HPr family phosphocarrier protein [Wenzhouxiangellaceae bacterium]
MAVTERVRLTNKLGLHARAASRLVRAASAFDCEVWLTRDGRRVNGKSIMGVLMLAAPCGAELEIECFGSDEQQALRTLVELIADRFGEAQ